VRANWRQKRDDISKETWVWSWPVILLRLLPKAHANESATLAAFVSFGEVHLVLQFIAQ
jgi:hypothetical protein